MANRMTQTRCDI